MEVRYREPSYEAYTGARREPYQFRYRVDAPSEEAAVAMVMAEFERTSALSAVGWIREIVEVVVSSAFAPLPELDSKGQLVRTAAARASRRA